ncbi:histone-like nucleoid-structuring protein Lsr2 [Streptomyces sp. NPDC096153]|uniref:Lsr2 family DNA-binding protein n=1 Tax=Streptomyces sp. NPDC096153 TaxID=3155548 RepID=UPI003333FC47
MTIAALRALLDAEQPDIPRHPAPWIPHTAHRATEHHVTTSSHTTPDPAPQLSVGQLLAWATDHTDPSIKAHGERARESLAALRQRHQADIELADLTTEEAELQRRLDELRSRKAELQPPPKNRRPERDYDPKAVRAWAREHGHDVPDRGQIPKAALQAWRDRARAEGEG